ncbi:hypothetical protein WJX77_012642 [Trebouxia sp. C0004]
MWDHAAAQGPSPAVTGIKIASDVPGPSHQELGGAAAAHGMSSAMPGYIEQPVVMANAAVDQALQELNLPPEQEVC